MASVPAPPTPVLLYLGAGFDLSPILSFSPSPPYQIDQREPDASGTPQRTVFTSFLFADAKPRHTSAFMVPDFDQWRDVPARVRNVIKYAQGMLDRWRAINDDLIWFEGGGSPSLVSERRSDPEWNLVRNPPSPFPNPRPQHVHIHDRPLTTLFYVFNTLDIELVRMPALVNVWPCVSAVYVHGLRPHPITGLDSVIGQSPARGTHGLQHVYVLVGSWGTPRSGRARGAGAQRGVRHVDFVKAARRRLRSGPRPTHSHDDDDSDTDTSHSPIVFRRPRSLSWSGSTCTSDGGSFAESPSGAANGTTTVNPRSSPPPAVCSPPDFSTFQVSSPRPSPRTPFYTRIPQIAWDDTLYDGRGGYYVYKTVEESLAVWRARGEGLLETENEDSASEEDHDTLPNPRPHFTPQHNPFIHSSLRIRPRVSRSTAMPELVFDHATTIRPNAAPPRRTFWPTKFFPLRERSRQVSLSEFLHSPAPISVPNKPYSNLRTHSCPDLKPAQSRPRLLGFSRKWPPILLKTKSGGKRRTCPRNEAVWLKRLIRPRRRKRQEPDGYESDLTCAEE